MNMKKKLLSLWGCLLSTVFVVILFVVCCLVLLFLLIRSVTLKSMTRITRRLWIFRVNRRERIEAKLERAERLEIIAYDRKERWLERERESVNDSIYDE
jgi:uncharacterized protein HemY